jgi:hypothetical protein
MKTLQPILIKVMFSLFAVCSATMWAHAQENSPLNPDNEKPQPAVGHGNNDDQILLDGRDSQRDLDTKSEALRPERPEIKQAAKPPKAEANEQNSAVSFNFIYYFFQKFKFSE